MVLGKIGHHSSIEILPDPIHQASIRRGSNMFSRTNTAENREILPGGHLLEKSDNINANFSKRSTGILFVFSQESLS